MQWLTLWKLFIYTFKLGTFTELTATEINGGALVHLNISPSASVSLLVLQHSLKSGAWLPFRQATDRNRWELRYIHAIKHRCSLNIWRGNELCQLYWGSCGPGSQGPFSPAVLPKLHRGDTAHLGCAQGSDNQENCVTPACPSSRLLQLNWRQILYT